jgi:hypothetical protein
MQLPVDFDECHRPLVDREDRQRGGAQILADERSRGGGDGRDGWWSAAVREAEAVDDVLGIDPRPHRDPQFGELRADLAELDGQGLLSTIDHRRLREQLRALRVKGGGFNRTVRHLPVTGGIANGRRHSKLPMTKRTDEGSSNAA